MRIIFSIILLLTFNVSLAQNMVKELLNIHDSLLFDGHISFDSTQLEKSEYPITRMVQQYNQIFSDDLQSFPPLAISCNRYRATLGKKTLFIAWVYHFADSSTVEEFRHYMLSKGKSSTPLSIGIEKSVFRYKSDKSKFILLRIIASTDEVGEKKTLIDHLRKCTVLLADGNKYYVGAGKYTTK